MAIPSDPAHPWFDHTMGTTNHLFFSYLIYDLAHVVWQYPSIGGLDTIAHHCGFIFASLVCATYRLFPLAFGWLMMGELSTIPLDIRFVLIATGRGDTLALKVAQILFALFFLLSRVVLYGLGLAHLWYHRASIGVGTVAPAVPQHVAYGVLALIATGYGLNLMWLRGIIRVVTSGPPKPKA